MSNPRGMNKTSIRKRYPEFYKFLINEYPNELSFTERLYWYHNNWKEYRNICPICGKHTPFKSYTKGYQQYCSSQCSNRDDNKKKKIKITCLERYGGIGYSSKELQSKAMETSQNRYGDTIPRRTKQVNDKIKRTCLERYGSEYPLGSDQIWEKIKDTNLKKYGTEFTGSSELIRCKMKQTNRERYGVDNPMQSDVLRNRMKQTNRERYGVDFPFQSQDIQERGKQTRMDKYGEEHALNIQEFKDKAKQTCLEKYGAESYSKTDKFKNMIKEMAPTIQSKIKQTNKLRYGVSAYTQTNEYKDREYVTKKKNNSFNTSKIEKDFKNWLDENHINYKYQYRSDSYPFNCDFYFPDKDLYLEIQGSWVHGKHPYDPLSQTDQNTLKRWIDKRTTFYNNAIEVWTVKDPEKRNWAKEHNLNWIEVFSTSINDVTDAYKNNTK